MDYNEIYHHGIKGQKWGVRRFQNKDGSLTPAGKKRQRDDSPEAVAKRKAIAKKVAAGAVMTLTVAAAATMYAKSPAARRVVNSMGKKTVAALKKGGSKAVKAGKAYVKTSIAGMKEGFKEAAKEAPKKAVNAVMVGVAMNATKRALDATVGKAEAERIMKANNKKKIDSFWKVREEEDD